MATFSASANSNTTIGYALYGNTTWNVGASSSAGACQGAYQGTTASMSRVGVMVFPGAGAALRGRNISKIELSITCSSSGSGRDTKVLTFHAANTQSLDTTITGSAQVGTTLGTLTGTFYNNTSSHTLDADHNAQLFAALKSYLEDGNSALVLYNGETSSSSSYSTNYARITSITMTVTYEEGSIVFVNQQGTLHPHAVYICESGTLKRCLIYAYKNGSIKQV